MGTGLNWLMMRALAVLLVVMSLFGPLTSGQAFGDTHEDLEHDEHVAEEGDAGSRSSDNADKADEGERSEKEEDPFEEMPEAGVLSSMGSGIGSRAVGAVEASSFNSLPVTAGVSRSGDKFIVKATNSAKKAITLSLKLTQSTTQRKPIKRDYLTISLKPEGTETREVSAAPGANDAVLEMTRWSAR